VTLEIFRIRRCRRLGYLLIKFCFNSFQFCFIELLLEPSVLLSFFSQFLIRLLKAFFVVGADYLLLTELGAELANLFL
jgi:hypothetical protein